MDFESSTFNLSRPNWTLSWSHCWILLPFNERILFCRSSHVEFQAIHVQKTRNLWRRLLIRIIDKDIKDIKKSSSCYELQSCGQACDGTIAVQYGAFLLTLYEQSGPTCCHPFLDSATLLQVIHLLCTILRCFKKILAQIVLPGRCSVLNFLHLLHHHHYYYYYH